MANALKCDICGGFFNVTTCDRLESSRQYPNRIGFLVNFVDECDKTDLITHYPETNPAKTALSMLDNEFAKYDVCPNCMGEITSLMGKLHLKSKVKEEK